MSSRPFIIYTAQRTGGTNFASKLASRAPWPKAPAHEPFNLPRAYGSITRAWTDTGDRNALDAAMADICGRGEIIKHCVETVPVEITEALSAAALAANYHHLFLYRTDTVARLLSLEYARRTRIFGPAAGVRLSSDFKKNLSKIRRMLRYAVRKFGDARIFREPLDIDALLEREAVIVERLNSTWQRLEDEGARPLAVAYEDLYGPDAEHARRTLLGLLDSLGLSHGQKEDLELFGELRLRGDQGTRERYSNFQGIDALRQGVGRLPPLAFAARRQ